MNPELKLFVESRKGRNWTTKSISISPRVKNLFSRYSGAELVFRMSRHPRKSCFRRTRFPLVHSRPMRFRGEWTSDSSLPHRDTSEKLFSDELDSHWFPVNQCGFQVPGRRIWASRIEIHQKNEFPENSIPIGFRSTNGVSW